MCKLISSSRQVRKQNDEATDSRIVCITWSRCGWRKLQMKSNAVKSLLLLKKSHPPKLFSVSISWYPTSYVKDTRKQKSLKIALVHHCFYCLLLFSAQWSISCKLQVLLLKIRNKAAFYCLEVFHWFILFVFAVRALYLAFLLPGEQHQLNCLLGDL